PAVGPGSWGTTLAILAARQGRPTHLLTRTQEEAEAMSAAGENGRFMLGYAFPPGLTPTADPELALRDCELLLMVVPSQTMRANIRGLRPYVERARPLVVSAAKGLELKTLLRMTEVLAQELGEEYGERLGALSGPNLA